MPQAGGLRAAFAFGHGTQVAVQRGAGVRGGQRKGHLEDPVRVVTPDGQTHGREHVLHRLVLGEGLGGERGYLTAPGQRDQVLQQQGGDAPVVHVVGHRERDLRRALAAGLWLAIGNAEAGHTDHRAAAQREQRAVIGTGLLAGPARFLRRGQPAEVEEAHVGVFRRHRFVHGLDRVEIIRAGRADLDRGPVSEQRVHLVGLLFHVSLPVCLLTHRVRRRGRRRWGKRPGN